MTRDVNEQTDTAVVLAGGLGTRLAGLIPDKPKVLAPLLGRSFLDWKFDEMERNGIRHVYLLLGHQSDLVINKLSSLRTRLDVTPILDGPRPRGTGGAVLSAADELPEDFFLTYGDNLLDMPYYRLVEARQSASVRNALAVTPLIGPADTANCTIDNRRVTAYRKGFGDQMDYLDYGVMLMNRDSLTSADVDDGQALDLAQILQALILKKDLAAAVTLEPYYEIGTPESLARTEEQFGSR